MQTNETESKKAPATRGQKIAAITSVTVFLLVLILVSVFVGGPLVKTLGDPASFRAWVDTHGAWGRVLFVLLVILQVVVAFIPGEPFEIAAGYAFGAEWGTLLVWLGLTLGSILVFLFVRKVGVKAVEVFFPREKIDSMKYLNNEKALNATAFVLFLIPGTPKDFLTYVAGLTKIKLLPWIILTSVARLPSILTSTIGGDAIGTKNYTFAILVFVLTALVSGAGLLIYRAITRKRALAEAGRALASQPLAEYDTSSAGEPVTPSGEETLPKS